MSCSCDYEGPKFWSQHIHTARKVHRCCECGSAIQPGDKYEYVAGMWDDFEVFKTCSRCLDLREFVRVRIPCFCWAHGNVHEDALETAKNYDEFPGLLFGVHRRIILADRQPKWIKA